MNRFFEGIAEDVLRRISLDPLKGKSLLITGSNGLLGSHLASVIAFANRQRDLGARITCVSRSAPSSWIKENSSDAFIFIQSDLAQTAAPEGTFDFIIHAATYGQPKKFMSRALETMRLNSFTTAHLLDLASKNNASFLYMSSSEIYGNPPAEVSPVTEDYPGNVSPLDHRSPYTSSKRFGETLCKVYSDTTSAKARIARVSSVYGPGSHLIDDRVLNVFIRRALEEKKLRLMDDGAQKRRWLYISDALVMLFHILLYSKEIVYNVCGTDIRSVAELARYIGEQTHVPVLFPERVEAAQHTLGAPTLINISNERILKEAKLQNLISLKDGLSSCIKWTSHLLENREKGIQI